MQVRPLKADVADSFLQRDESEQGRILKEQLISKYETRIPPRGSEEKGVLDYLALIETTGTSTEGRTQRKVI